MGVTDTPHFLVFGVLLGVAAGVSPGPLLALVISETLMHSRKEGILVSMAPVLTDLPIIAATVYILSKISNYDFVLGLISFAGAVFIMYLAYENIMIKEVDMNISNVKPRSLVKGMITNFLSPHPYLFWLTIGAPTMMKACQVSIPAAVLFVVGFYISLIGSKVLVALLVSRSKHFLQSRTYVHIIKITGVSLLIFAGLFLKDALINLGLL